MFNLFFSFYKQKSLDRIEMIGSTCFVALLSLLFNIFTYKLILSEAIESHFVSISSLVIIIAVKAYFLLLIAYKRCIDIGINRFFSLLIFIPVVNFYFYFKKGGKITSYNKWTQLSAIVLFMILVVLIMI